MPVEHERTLKVVVLGGGNVGAEVVRLLRESAEDLAARTGARLEVVGVLVRDAEKVRAGVPAELVSTDAEALLAMEPDLVIELIGGIDPARQLISEALASGSSVVTANKALIATHGAELHRIARESGVDLYYEAAVAGAIPLLRPLRESLGGDKVRRVLGIVNGTTNFILSKMDSTGADFDEVLAEAQALGYAEADPTADVGGFDAAAKAAILASLAFHTRVTMEDVAVEGITDITAKGVEAARDMGFVIKLLAVAELIEKDGGAGVSVRVHPTMVPLTHPLASVRDAFNAVFVEAEAAGQIMFYGRGAGGTPTASAVLGDVVAAARNKVAGSVGPGESSYADLPVLPIGESRTSYAINLLVADAPGVLASIASAFAERGVSIQTLRQDDAGEDATLLLRTHVASEAALAATVDALRDLPAVKDVLGVIRVESAQ